MSKALPMPGSHRRRGLVCTAAVLVAVVPLFGCQAILGIKDPVVAGVGPDGTVGRDASSADAAAGSADGGARNRDAQGDAGSYGIPASRTRTAMVYDAGHHRLVLFGGDHFGQRLGDTWEWDGVGWTDVTPPSGSPPPRSDATMTYDAAVGKVVLVGGVDATDQIFGDVWEWDGTSWTNVTPSSGNPTARLAAGIAFDAGCNCALLFGGAHTTYLGDTWQWEGASRSWTPLNSPVSPSARDAFSMAYDAKDQAVLLFGGQDGNDLGDTWEWNATGWSQQQPASSPVPGPHYPMAYDAKRGRAVLFGASMSGGNVESNHTWEWDGTTWTDVTPASGSPPPGEYAMAYDAALERTIMYAGGPDMYAWDGTSWSTL